jgi:hypothetical protein
VPELPRGAWTTPRATPKDVEGKDIKITQLWVHPIKVSGQEKISAFKRLMLIAHSCRAVEARQYRRQSTHPLGWRFAHSPLSEYI